MADAGSAAAPAEEDARLGWRFLVRLRRTLLQEMWRASPPVATLLIVSIIVPAFLSGGFVIATGVLVDAVQKVARDGMSSPAGHTVTVALVVAGILYALQMVLHPLGAAAADVLGRKLEGRMRGIVMRSVLAPPGVAHLEQPDVADRISMAQVVGIGEIRPRAAVQAVNSKYSDQLQGFVAAALLFGYAWWAPPLFLAGWAFVRYAWVKSLRNSVQLNALQTRSLRRSGYFRDLVLTAPAAKETRIFGLGGWLVDRFVREWTGAMAAVWQERRRGGARLWISILLLAGIHFSVFMLLGRQAAAGTVSLGALAVYLQAILGLEAAVSYDLDHKIDSGSRPVLAAVELEREMADPAYEMPGDRPADGLPRLSIRFEGVGFRYPGVARPVFTGLDLEIPVGRSLAIVGENGAGKTTLTKLLARLYDPTSGRITVDGIDLRTLDAGGWTRRVAAIFQDFVHYQLSAADNVGFGAVSLAGDPDALNRAAREAGALDLVQSLPDGWETVLSREFEHGTDLSGGQWQRVALARALMALHGGAGVLVLDEPTAHLDARAEARFFDRFLELTEGRTTVVISHRFSTVRRADRIVVLRGGAVAEQGTHDELMAADGHYARMFRVQAARFAEPAAKRSGADV